MTTLQAARNLFRLFTSKSGFDSTLKQVIVASFMRHFVKKVGA